MVTLVADPDQRVLQSDPTKNFGRTWQKRHNPHLACSANWQSFLASNHEHPFRWWARWRGKKPEHVGSVVDGPGSIAGEQCTRSARVACGGLTPDAFVECCPRQRPRQRTKAFQNRDGIGPCSDPLQQGFAVLIFPRDLSKSNHCQSAKERQAAPFDTQGAFSPDKSK